MGIVIMFIGFTGKAFDKDTTVEVGVGENVPSRRLRDEDPRDSWTATTRTTPGVTPRSTFSRTAKLVRTLEPERRGYKASRQPTSEVAIWRRLNEDVYLNFAGFRRGQQQGGHSGVHLPAGILDLDRLLGAPHRHHRLPDSEQGEAAIRANPGGRRHVQTIC